MEKQPIGLYQGIALYMAAILGSGVLFLSGVTASIAGPASILSWLLVIILSFPLAYSFACLARDYPDAGGAATFVRKAFGFHSGNLVGWFYFVTAAVGQTIVSLTGAFYVSHAFDLPLRVTPLIAILILTIAGITNYYGVQVSGKVALVLSTCLLLILLIAVFAAFPMMEWEQFSPFLPHGWFSVGKAMTFILWSFFGWEAITNLADHFKKPENNIVRSTIISAVIIGTLFLALSIVTIGTGTYGSMERNLSPLGVMIGERLGIGAKMTTGIMAFMICTGTSNAFVASLTQLGYSLSRDGAFPKILSVLHPVRQIPRRMVVFVIGFASAGVVMTDFFSVTFDDFLFIPTSLGIFVYIFSMAAGVRLFKGQTLPRWCSALSLILCLLVLPFFEWFISVPIIITGLYFGYMMFLQKKRSEPRRMDAHEHIR